MSDSNSALIRRWFEEVWNKKRIEAIDEMVAPGSVSHGHDAFKPISVAEMKQFVVAMLAGFPDIHFELEEPVSQGDRASAFWRAEMTHTGAFMGVAPTGRKISIYGIGVARFRDGKIVESWNSWDQFGLMSQIGAISTPAIFTRLAPAS